MFEFHGWVVIRAHDRDDPDPDVLLDREEAVVERVRTAIGDVDDKFSLFDLRRTGNGLIVLFAHGLRNHRFEPVIELFRRITVEVPDAYGVLYVHDDEDPRSSNSFRNEFRVWRMARGTIEERDDPFLSPYIPTVEPPWEWPEGT
jgi:hypothetical protein